MAGAITRASGSVPYFASASVIPATAPGTPEARCPSWLRPGGLPLASTYMLRGAAVGEVDDHEAAAADVAGDRVGHGEREPDRDRGVDRVPAGLEDLDARLARQPAVARDHRVLAEGRRLAGAEAPAGGEGGRA